MSALGCLGACVWLVSKCCTFLVVVIQSFLVNALNWSWTTTDFWLSAEGEKPFLEPHSPNLPSFCFRSMAKIKNTHVMYTVSNPIVLQVLDFKLQLLYCDSSSSFKPWLELLGLWKNLKVLFLCFLCSLFLGNERRKGNWGNSYNWRRSKWGAHRRSI